jgi:methylenetetrahydrofolate--tRNA-(uracil-5-)-methyltransferase
MTGVEGYIESTSSGFLAGFNAARKMKGLSPFIPDNRCAIGALANYVSDRTVTSFQPMNVNFGIFEDLGMRIKDKREKAECYAERSFEEIDVIVKKGL